ncbi:MAG: filamentous hemagglutinin N-terminal domain-containing protein [Planctomycetota bacterium]|jgi:filamentous hemagglutinin family protein
MKTFAHNPFIRIAHKSIAYLLVFCIVNMPVWALNANDADVSSGTANITGAANTVSVDLITNRAVLDWTQMNATNAETLNFTGSSGFAVLNRVASAVDFNGALNGAGGHIFVVSPHGVIIGPDATITASSFTASSLNITNGDFMNSIYKFSGDGAGEVSNYGSISAQQVALIGKQILNAGTISSPGGYTVLAAGDTVYLNPEGSNVVVEVTGVTVPENPAIDGIGDVINEGTIEAVDGQIIMAAGDTFSRAIEGVDQMTVAVESGIGRVGQFGTLNANGSDGNGGNITLTAADSVVLGQDSVTTANAGLNGDGGSIVVYSPDTAMLRGGSIEAKGGSESGNGGFVELSGKQYFEMYGSIDLSATTGQDGTLVFDPYDITIVPGTGNELDPSGDIWQPVAESSTIGILTLEELLGTSNVILSTIGSVGVGAEDGDIIFAAVTHMMILFSWKEMELSLTVMVMLNFLLKMVRLPLLTEAKSPISGPKAEILLFKPVVVLIWGQSKPAAKIRPDLLKCLAR